MRSGEHTLFVSAQGASILLWQVGVAPILGPAISWQFGERLVECGVSHWCFPYHGNIAESAPLELGETGAWPRHGALCHSPMSILNFTDDSMEFICEILAKRTLRWRYQVYVKYTLSTHKEPALLYRLTALLRATNISLENARAPVLPGFSPCFCRENARAHFGLKELPTPKSGPVGPMVHDFLDPTVVDLGFGSVLMTVSDNCQHAVVWSEGTEHYLCVQPVFGGEPGTFGLPYQQRYLEHRESIECEVTLDYFPGLDPLDIS